MNRFETQIAIVGAGPAGLAAAHALQSAGYSVELFEQGALAEHVAQSPTYMTYFSTADLLELAGFPLIIAREKPTKQEYLNYLRRFVVEKKLRVHTGCEILGMDGESGRFRLFGVDRAGGEFEVFAERVILATGAFASPQRLGVPGEELPHVSHYFTDVHRYFGSKVLIVGGRNGAAETALELWRAGIEASICHRRPAFDGLKYWLGPDLENRVKSGQIRAYRPARVLRILPRSVELQVEGEAPREVPADFVLALTGYRPDPKFLAKFRIPADPATGRPVHNPTTLESPRPGVYMAGVMLAGNISGEIFIENSRTHGDRILEHLRASGFAKKP